jgi:hypothetical protein
MQRRKASGTRDINASASRNEVLDHFGVSPSSRTVNWRFAGCVDVVDIGTSSDESLCLFHIAAPRRPMKRRFSSTVSGGEFVGSLGHGDDA